MSRARTFMAQCHHPAAKWRWKLWVGPPGISSFALVVIFLSEPQYARELDLRVND